MTLIVWGSTFAGLKGGFAINNGVIDAGALKTMSRLKLLADAIANVVAICGFVANPFKGVLAQVQSARFMELFAQ